MYFLLLYICSNSQLYVKQTNDNEIIVLS
jgi:hypothetical protein